MRDTDELLRHVRRRGGIAHSSTMRAEGFGDHAMRAAVAAGRALRVARSWLAAPDCDATLLRAAQVGGRVTCITAAARLGLWIPPPGPGASTEPLHLAVPATWSRARPEDATLHWSSGPAPVPLRELIDPALNVLFHVSRCLAPADAVAVWESAIRGHHVDPAELALVDWPGVAARGLAATASDLSDSGLETRFVRLMRTLGVEVRQQAWIDGHRVDALIGHRLIVQLDGFTHHQAAERRRDLRADARLALRGYTVLRFDYVQVLLHPEEVIAAVTMAIAQGLHRA